MVSEDATQHGRLIDMKDQLIDLMPDKKLTAEQLALFYAKDIITHRKLDANAKESYKLLISSPPEEEEIKAIIKKRMSQALFNRIKLFNSGKLKIQDEFQKITEAVCNKDGIVPDDVKDKFRNNLQNWRRSNSLKKKLDANFRTSPQLRQQLMSGILEEQTPDLHSALKKHKSLTVDETDSSN